MKIAPTSLSATKLHELQSHDLGGVHSRLMGIHVAMRSALKIVLRSYENIGGVSTTFSSYKPMNIYSVDGEVDDRFMLPNRAGILAEISEDDIEQEMPVSETDIVSVVKEKIMLARFAENQANKLVSVLSELNEADNVLFIGKKQQETMEEFLWDGLQYLVQLDLTIKDAREAKIEEYLTAGFKSSLKAANRDKTVKSARHKKDVLLHHKVDKMEKEEARSNSKVVSAEAPDRESLNFIFRLQRCSSPGQEDLELTPQGGPARQGSLQERTQVRQLSLDLLLRPKRDLGPEMRLTGPLIRSKMIRKVSHLS